MGRRDAIRLFGAAATAVAIAPSITPRTHRPATPLPPPVSVYPGLQIYPRETWADRMPQLWAPGPEEVRFLLVHHTASGNNYDEAGAIDVMRSVYRFHTGPEKGWPDVCYNFFIDRFGRVFEGRDGSLDGPVLADATGGSQGFAQLVCLLGDFTDVMPTDAAVASLRTTLAWLADRFALDTAPGATTQFVSRGSNKWPAGADVTAAIISGHRDMTQTACPGDTFYPYVRDQLQSDMHNLRLATSPPTTAPPTTAPPTTAPPTTAPPSAALPATSVAVDSAPPAATTVPATTASAASDAAAPSNESSLPRKLALPLLGGAAVIGGATWMVRKRMSTADNSDTTTPDPGPPTPFATDDSLAALVATAATLPVALPTLDPPAIPVVPPDPVEPSPGTGTDALDAAEFAALVAPNAPPPPSPLTLHVVAAARADDPSPRTAALLPHLQIVQEGDDEANEPPTATFLRPTAGGEQARYWAAADSARQFQVVAGYSEKRLGLGEDADPTMLVNLRAQGFDWVLAVYDGLGGAGARVACSDGGHDYTEAFVASRLARFTTERWFLDDCCTTGTVDVGILRERLLARLGRVKDRSLPAAPSGIVSTMQRTLPTTIAGIAGVGGRTTAFWAGDSRAYLLTPQHGLQQLTDDHVRNPDIVAQLRNNAPMSNVVSMTKPFRIDTAVVEPVDGRAVYFVASDGMFDYIATPGLLEFHILESLAAATSTAEWPHLLIDTMSSLAGDDCTFVALAFGFETHALMQADFAPRLDWLRRTQLDTGADQPDPWALYEAGYTARLATKGSAT